MPDEPVKLIALDAPSNVIVPTASDLISRFVPALTDMVVPEDIEVPTTLDIVILLLAPTNTSFKDTTE